MANSPRMRWPYPTEGVDPWYAAFEDMVSAQDASIFALEESKNVIPSGGGTFSWSALTGVLSWSGTLYFNSANSGFLESVPAGSATLVEDGSMAYVRFISAPQDNLSLVMRVTDVLPSSDPDRCFVLCRRAGSRVVFRNGGVLQDGQSAAIIENGPAASTSETTFKRQGTTFAVTDKLNFTGAVSVAGSSGGGVASIELQLAADSAAVTTTPYFFDPSYRNFYVNRISPTDFYLPTASSVASQYLLVKTLTAQAVTIYRIGSDTIDGLPSYTLTSQYESVLLHSGTLDGGTTWNWFVATKGSSGGGGGGGNVTFTMPTATVIAVGDLVASDAAGNAVRADSTVAGSYPALGVCTTVLGAVVTVQPTGPSNLFAGLVPGSTYYLGTNGSAVSTPPVGAFLSQAVLQSYAANAGVLLTGGTVIGL